MLDKLFIKLPARYSEDIDFVQISSLTLSNLSTSIIKKNKLFSIHIKNNNNAFSYFHYLTFLKITYMLC